jgi:APA family basic amino acid/polyamine antiporter
MLIGTGLVIVIYCGVNLALLSILSVPEIAASKLPVATAFARLFGGRSGRIIIGLAALNIVGQINTLYLLAPRVLFAMARDGLFLRRAAAVSRTGVPIFATVFSGIAGMATFFGGSFERVFSVSSVLSVVCYAAGFASLFALRRKHPTWPRPFRVWGYPIVPAAALLGAVLVLAGTIAEDRAVAVGAFCLVGLSYPVYLLMRRHQSSD